MIFLYLLFLVPISLTLAFFIKASPVWIFGTSVLAIIPLAVWIQRGTEQAAQRTGPSIGGLLNISFGNAAELVLALFVLSAGNPEVVKAQITGSIIGNSLLGLGLAIIIGTWGKTKLSFNKNQAGLLSTLLMLVLIGLLLPAIFDITERDIINAPNALALDESLSLAVSVVLISLYIGNLVYTLVTHHDVLSTDNEERKIENVRKVEIPWPLWMSLLILAAATAVTALEAELVSSSLESTAATLGVTTFFLGVIVLAVIGNVAEYVSAIYFAKKGDMDLVMQITVGSTVQVALLVAPLLVLVSYLMGKPMNLVFNNPIELISIAGVAFIVNAISKDGEVTWFEGALLVGIYILFGMAFFLVTPG